MSELEHSNIKSRRSLWIRRVVVGLFSVLVMGLIGAWIVGGYLIASANREVGQPPSDLSVEELKLLSRSGTQVATWFVDTPQAQATIILAHGVRANRDAMLSRARWLLSQGLSVVLIDLQAHGESPGRQITFGHLEQFDVRAAVEFARLKHPEHKIVVDGVSLGGAATLLGSPLSIDALIIESVYPTIQNAVHNRIEHRVGTLHHLLAPMLLCQLRFRLGISPNQLCPVERIDSVDCPILIMGGTQDAHTTEIESRQMFARAREPKRLQLFQGAGHIDLMEFDGGLWRTTVADFLTKALKANTATGNPQNK